MSSSLPLFRLVKYDESMLIPEAYYFQRVFRVCIFIRTDINETLNKQADTTHFYIDEGQFKQRIDYRSGKIELKNKARFSLPGDEDEEKKNPLVENKIHYFPRLSQDQVVCERVENGFFNKILSLISIFQVTRWFRSYYSCCLAEAVEAHGELSFDDWWEQKIVPLKSMSAWSESQWQVGLFVEYIRWCGDVQLLMQDQQGFNYDEEMSSQQDSVASLQELYGVKKGKLPKKQSKHTTDNLIPLSTIKHLVKEQGKNEVEVRYYILKHHNMIDELRKQSDIETIQRDGKRWLKDWFEEIVEAMP